LSQQGKNIIFDEIQYLPDILVYLKMIIDESRDINGSFILTGSQQFRMMKDVTETLAGRAGILHLLTLSHDETLAKKNPLASFIQTCLRGSYPELCTHPKYSARAWYDSYVQTYLERDIKSIYNVGNLRDFHRFMRLMASRCSQQLNMSNIAKDLGVAVNTIKKWISLLEASYIIYLLPPYYGNIGKRLTKSPKIYFTDCGLVSHLLGLKQQDELLSHPNIGALYENYCIQEIVKHFENKGIRPELYYIRTKTGKEIDLLLEVKDGFIPVEIKFSKTINEKKTNAMNYFANEAANLKLNYGFIISLVNKKTLIEQNISVCNINIFLKHLNTLH
jgi:predicted AAA+ superfamily ATPase